MKPLAVGAMQEAQQRSEGPQKVIVFSTFLEALHIMADTLAHSKLGFVMLHGQMDLDERSEASSSHLGTCALVHRPRLQLLTNFLPHRYTELCMLAGVSALPVLLSFWSSCRCWGI